MKAKYKRLNYKDLLGDFTSTVTATGATSLSETNFNQIINDVWGVKYINKEFAPEVEKINREARAHRLGLWLKYKRK